MRKTLVGWILAALWLSGCAPYYPPLSTDYSYVDLLSRRASQACDLTSQPQLHSLSGLIPLSYDQLRQMNLRMLALDTKPTSDERQALLAYDELNEACVTAAKAYCQASTASRGPAYCAAQSTMLTDNKANLVDLYQGRQTFGEYNVRAQSIYKSFEQAWANQTQADMRAAQRAVVVAPSTVTTNCSSSDNGNVTCTSQPQ